MTHLPWLLLHAYEALLVALGGFVLVGAALGVARPALATALRARLFRRWQGETTPPSRFEDGQSVVLAGTLVGTAQPRSFDDRAEATLATLFRAHAGRKREPMIVCAASDAAIEIEGVRVALEGEPVVLVGSRETRAMSFHRASARARESAIEADPDGAFALESTGARVTAASLVAGDAIVARGKLRRLAPDGGRAGYRTAAGSWALTFDRRGDSASAGPDRSGSGVAFAGRPRVELRPPHGALSGAIFGVFAFAIALVTLGELGAGAARSALREGPKRIEAIPGLGLAAMDPLRRDEILAELSATLHAQRHHDRERTEALVELDVLRGDTAGRVRALLDHGQLARAATFAVKSSDPAMRRVAADAFDRIGDFDAASDAILGATPDPLSDAIVHALAGKFDRAAIAARAYATEPGEPDRIDVRCVAEALGYLANGDDGRLQALRSYGMFENGAMCQLLLADLRQDLSTKERDLERVNYGARGPALDVLLPLERLLNREIGAARVKDPKRLMYPAWLVYGRAEQHLIAFFPAMFERDDLLVGSDRNGALEAAVVASAIGSHRQARALVDRLREAPRPTDHELYEGDGLLPSMAEAIERRARAEDATSELQTGWLAQGIDAWRSGAAHDGEALAGILDDSPNDADHLYLVARTIGAHREAVLDWLRYGRRQPRAVSHLGRLAELENLRLAAFALGDEEQALAIDAIEAKVRDALLRRSSLFVVSLLESARYVNTVSGNRAARD